MGTNIRTHTKTSEKVIYPVLSYDLVGILFYVHKEIGQYGREKQYADAIEQKLDAKKLIYRRELAIGNTGNILDFLIEDKIVLELKAKKALTSEDFRQTQHYLQETGFKLGILVNFREKYLKPLRIIRIETTKKLQ